MYHSGFPNNVGREPPPASSANLFNSGFGQNSPVNMMNQYPFDSFVNDATSQAQSGPISLPPQVTAPPPMINRSGPPSLENSSTANPFRSTSRRGRNPKVYQTAGTLFGAASPMQQTSNSYFGAPTQDNTGFISASFEPSTLAPSLQPPVSAPPQPPISHHMQPPNSHYMQSPITAPVQPENSHHMKPPISAPVQSPAPEVLSISQPQDYVSEVDRKQSVEVDMIDLATLSALNSKDPDDDPENCRRNLKFNPVGKKFSQYQPTEISQEKIQKAVEENALKVANREKSLERVKAKRDQILEQQKQSWEKIAKEREQQELLKCFENDNSPLNVVQKPKSKEERKLIRERAKKARMKKTERPGDLSSLIDEISSQTPSLCSDLSEQPDGVTVTLLPSSIPQQQQQVIPQTNDVISQSTQAMEDTSSGSSFGMITQKSSESECRLSPYQVIEGINYPLQSPEGSSTSSPLEIIQNVSVASSTYEKVGMPSSTSSASMDVSSFEITESAQYVPTQDPNNVHLAASDENVSYNDEPSSTPSHDMYNVESVQYSNTHYQENVSPTHDVDYNPANNDYVLSDSTLHSNENVIADYVPSSHDISHNHKTQDLLPNTNTEKIFNQFLQPDSSEAITASYNASNHNVDYNQETQHFQQPDSNAPATQYLQPDNTAYESEYASSGCKVEYNQDVDFTREQNSQQNTGRFINKGNTVHNHAFQYASGTPSTTSVDSPHANDNAANNYLQQEAWTQQNNTTYYDNPPVPLSPESQATVNNTRLLQEKAAMLFDQARQAGSSGDNFKQITPDPFNLQLGMESNTAADASVYPSSQQENRISPDTPFLPPQSNTNSISKDQNFETLDGSLHVASKLSNSNQPQVANFFNQHTRSQDSFADNNFQPGENQQSHQTVKPTLKEPHDNSVHSRDFKHVSPDPGVNQSIASEISQPTLTSDLTSTTNSTTQQLHNKEQYTHTHLTNVTQTHIDHHMPDNTFTDQTTEGQMHEINPTPVHFQTDHVHLKEAVPPITHPVNVSNNQHINPLTNPLTHQPHQHIFNNEVLDSQTASIQQQAQKLISQEHIVTQAVSRNQVQPNMIQQNSDDNSNQTTGVQPPVYYDLQNDNHPAAKLPQPTYQTPVYSQETTTISPTSKGAATTVLSTNQGAATTVLSTNQGAATTVLSTNQGAATNQGTALNFPPTSQAAPNFPPTSQGAATNFPPINQVVPTNFPPTNEAVSTKFPPTNQAVPTHFTQTNEGVPITVPATSHGAAPNFLLTNQGVATAVPPTSHGAAPNFPPTNQEVATPVQPTSHEAAPNFPLAYEGVATAVPPTSHEAAPNFPPTNQEVATPVQPTSHEAAPNFPLANQGVATAVPPTSHGAAPNFPSTYQAASNFPPTTQGAASNFPPANQAIPTNFPPTNQGASTVLPTNEGVATAVPASNHEEVDKNNSYNPSGYQMPPQPNYYAEQGHHMPPYGQQPFPGAMPYNNQQYPAQQPYDPQYAQMDMQSQMYWQYQQQMWYAGYYNQPYMSPYMHDYSQYGDWSGYSNYDHYSVHSSAASSAYGDSRPGSVIERRSSGAEEQTFSELEDLTSEMSFANRAETPEEKIIERSTPLSFTRPHVKARFSTTGGLLNIVAAKQPLDGEIASVDNIMLENAVDISMLKRFPGPLVRGESNKKSVKNFITETINVYLPKLYSDPKELFAHVALWEFVNLLIKQNGTFDGSDVAELLISLLPSVDMQGKESKQLSMLAHPPQNLEQENVEDFYMYLSTGRAKDGLEIAIHSGMWGHAFMLAAALGEKVLHHVQDRFMRSMNKTDPMKTFYGHMQSKNTGYIKKRANPETWVQNLCMIISHPTGCPEMDKEKIIAFGDSLRDYGLVAAAHLCYLIAKVQFGNHTCKDERIVLIGLEHKPYTDKSASVWAQDLNIQLTEIYQYACTLHEKSFAVPSFQTYKCEYALKLLEYGYPSQALAYLESISQIINSDQTFSAYEPAFVRKIIKFSDRILLQEAERFEDKETPSWLNGLQEYCEKYVSPGPHDHTNVKNTPSFADYSEENSTKSPDYSTEQSSSNEISSSRDGYEFTQQPPAQDENNFYPDHVDSGKVEYFQPNTHSEGHVVSDSDGQYDRPSQENISTYDDNTHTYNNEQYEQNTEGKFPSTQQDYYGNEHSSQPEYSAEQGYSNEQQDYGAEQPTYSNGQMNYYSPNQDYSAQSDYPNQTDYSSGAQDYEQTGYPRQPDYSSGQPDYSWDQTAAKDPQDNYQPSTQNDTHGQEDEEEDLFGGFTKKKAADIKETKPKAKGPAPKPAEAKNSKGLFGGIFSKFFSKEVHLPDDKDKSLVYDKELKRWVDKNADEEDTKAAPLPPPPTGNIGLPTGPPGSASKPVSGPVGMQRPPMPNTASPLIPDMDPRHPEPAPAAPMQNVIPTMPANPLPTSSAETQQQTPSRQRRNVRRQPDNKTDEGEEEKKPAGPPSKFSMRAQGGSGRRGANRYINVMGSATKRTPMAPVLDPMANLAPSSASKGNTNGSTMPMFFNPTQMTTPTSTPSAGRGHTISRR
ncbi:uncharacterized protein LOC130612627 isoform X2 [Hydractinia symbiolongicarpus]|uniref:uncharacterized protein LOC130612627 isoform X2 n=1 Tax=Hydractinia symbiolongicarpus TaxID=13093 RepID=UPI00255136F8|nr:uncharacterized protein LOC130612627 isoform X2 [Hydractinia symbiolongicarpus]